MGGLRAARQRGARLEAARALELGADYFFLQIETPPPQPPCCRSRPSPTPAPARPPLRRSGPPSSRLVQDVPVPPSGPPSG